MGSMAKDKKCRVCRKKFSPMNSLQVVCSPLCSIKLVEKKKKEKAKKQRKLTKVKLDALRPRSWWINKALTAFNKYIRERDKDEPCISCGRHHTGQYHAGHYMSRGARPELQFHPANNNKQCSPCNNNLSGNIVLYRKELLKKVGAGMVDYLENFNNPQHLTIKEIKEIEAHYKNELKLLG